ncbi:collagen alpha-1(XXV) chain [Labeo rohita]|uniref:collagen alpha-1(XXV) chain n=1 Tax=Labeo rohita TaxID=84645 RepID=UPI0021E3261C|nr:collagen alpha-1(XXV) chain [Labeo rohita]
MVERERVTRDLGASKDSRNAAKMENDIDPSKRRHCLRATVDLMPFVFSVVSFAFCFLLSVQTSEIKDRIANMEIGSGAGVINPFHGVSMDQFNAMIQERVDELLSRRSYEHLVRIRTARQVSPPECNCPPGVFSFAVR